MDAATQQIEVIGLEREPALAGGDAVGDIELQHRALEAEEVSLDVDGVESGRIDGVEQADDNTRQGQPGGLPVQLSGTQNQLHAPFGRAQQLRHRGTDTAQASLVGGGHVGE